MVCSCFGIKFRADESIVFYFDCTSFSFRVMWSSKYALEVILYYFIRVYGFALCFPSCLFLSAIEKSFTFPFSSVAVFHLPCTSFALGANPSYD